MARSKRDDLKRSVAQSVNHMAHAVLDLNEVYVEFTSSADRMRELQLPESEVDYIAKENEYREYAEYIKAVMISVSKCRDGALSFAITAWNIDEEQLIKYA